MFTVLEDSEEMYCIECNNHEHKFTYATWEGRPFHFYCDKCKEELENASES